MDKNTSIRFCVNFSFFKCYFGGRGRGKGEGEGRGGRERGRGKVKTMRVLW